MNEEIHEVQVEAESTQQGHLVKDILGFSLRKEHDSYHADIPCGEDHEKDDAHIAKHIVEQGRAKENVHDGRHQKPKKARQEKTAITGEVPLGAVPDQCHDGKETGRHHEPLAQRIP